MRESGKVGILVQARMRSKRLQGKALANIEGKSLLQRLCNRMRCCQKADAIIVATTIHPHDDAIVEECKRWGIAVFRGPEEDLTTRLLGAAKAYGLSVFVRVTADNPLTDPVGIDRMIDALSADCNLGDTMPVLVHNVHRNGYPYGTGAEVANCHLLAFCDRTLAVPQDREYFCRHAKQHPQQFRCVKINGPNGSARIPYFLTVDYEEDVVLQRKIYSHFAGSDEIPLEDICAFLDANPELLGLNSHLHQQFPD